MTEDLRLTLDTTQALTDDTTDLNSKSTWTPNYNTDTENKVKWASDEEMSRHVPKDETIDTARSLYYNSAGKINTGDGDALPVGISYNFFAATAGSGNSGFIGTDRNTEDSICPRNWQLPTNSGATSYYNLLTNYYPTTLDNDTNGKKFPLSIVSSGTYNWYDAKLEDRGRFGAMLVGTIVDNKTSAWRFYTYDRVQFSGNRMHGVAVRCLVRPL